MSKGERIEKRIQSSTYRWIGEKGKGNNKEVSIMRGEIDEESPKWLPMKYKMS